MRHTFLDCYGARKSKLDDMKFINNSLNELAYHIGVKTIAPPSIIPYYYCEEEQDIGISAYLFLKGGHITIHTFPLRECYFMDILLDGFFDSEKAYKFVYNVLPFNETASVMKTQERRIEINEVLEVEAGSDFGPHIMAKIAMDRAPSMEKIYNGLEQIVPMAGMIPISRPHIIKDSVTNSTFLSGMILIAQSHISLIYSYQEKLLYFDLFSCSVFDCSNINGFLKEKYGKVLSYQVLARGSKHSDKRAISLKNIENAANKSWIKNISSGSGA